MQSVILVGLDDRGWHFQIRTAVAMARRAATTAIEFQTHLSGVSQSRCMKIHRQAQLLWAKVARRNNEAVAVAHFPRILSER